MQAKIFNTNKRICISELPHSKLAKHIEDRVHNFMQEQKEKGDLHIGEITIRVLGSFDKRVDVRPNLKERYVALFCNCPLQSLDILSRDYIISILEPKILLLRNIKSWIRRCKWLLWNLESSVLIGLFFTWSLLHFFPAN